MKIYALLGSYICFRCFRLVDLVIQIILNVNFSWLNSDIFDDFIMYNFTTVKQ